MSKNNNVLTIGISVLLITLLFGTVYYFGFAQQTILSASQVNVGGDGKVYWVFANVGDSIDEGFTFNLRPEAYKKSDGTEVRPQSTRSISFSKENSYCEYPIIQQSKKILFVYDYKYEAIGNPSRVANILIKDNNGKTAIINGAQNGDTETITDNDGKGSLVVKSLGLISGPLDCPDYNDVAITRDSKGSNPRLVIKSDLENDISRYNTIFFAPLAFFNYLNKEVRENTLFTRNFDSYPTISSTSVRGDIDIGNGLFTLTADQDYFNSYVYNPPKQADPIITSIDTTDLDQGQTSSFKVNIKNNNNNKGIVLIKASGTNVGISPLSKSITLDKTATVTFSATGGSKEGNAEVCFEVCSTSQFEASNCDEDCESFKILEEKSVIDKIIEPIIDVTPQPECGDGTCDANENDAVCPQDCLIVLPEELAEKEQCLAKNKGTSTRYEYIPAVECSFIQKIPGVKLITFLFTGETCSDKPSECVDTYQPYIWIGIFASFILLIIGLVLAFKIKPKRIIRRVKRRK